MTALLDRVHFGAFELDLKAGELYSSAAMDDRPASRIVLSQQPFRLLLMLIERDGGMVTREEIQKKFWPNDTIVEFDHSINVAIGKLRKALGDSADAPQYIATVASRGYRLMVPVERISAADSADQVVAEVPSGAGTAVRLQPSRAVLIGQTVSHYRVLDIIGGGGMGVVYRAEDLKLGRRVAMKFLPDDVASDALTLQRFEREAKTASSLNHPNICTIYEFGEHQGHPFLVMELLQGETLRDRLAAATGKGLLLEELLDVAHQITDGLQAAHEQGVIHRDIKPANIFLTNKGVSKILDFGLAKLLELSEPEAQQHQDSLELAPEGPAEVTLTRTGSAMGTAGYMSPEQVRGDKLDPRTDLFSFGLVLYEMATGQRAFGGETVAIVRDAIVHQPQIPVRELNPNLAPKLESIINKALVKDREQRYQYASEVRADLQQLKRDSDSGRTSRPFDELPTGSTLIGGNRSGSLRGKHRLGIAFGLAAILGIAILAYEVARPLPPPTVSGYVQITNDGFNKVSSLGHSSLVTDGPRLYFTHAASGSEFSLAQVSTEGGLTVSIPTPFRSVLADVSPDHTKLLIVERSAQDEYPLWVLTTVGGSLQRVGDLRGDGATWSREGRDIVYSNGLDLLKVPVHGSESRKIVTLPGRADWIRYSPDGSHLRFTVNDPKTNSNSLWEVSADGSNLHPLLAGWSNPADECCGNWTPGGKYFVFQSTRGGRTGIYAIAERENPFRTVRKSPVLLTVGPLNYSSPVSSLDGKRIYVVGSLPRGELQRYDSKAGQLAPFLSGLSAEGLDFSRDGQWLAYVTFPEGNLWRSKADGSERMQLTFSPLAVLLPRWSPDGKQLAFAAADPGKPHSIYLISANGGQAQQLTTGEDNDGDVGWSADGNRLVFGSMGPNNPTSGIRIMDLKTRQISLLPNSKGLFSPRWSPDGNYIAALTMRFTLVVFDFRTQKWVDLADLPTGYPNWSRDSKYVYFDTRIGAPAAFYRVGLGDHTPERLFGLTNLRRTGTFQWIGLGPDDSPLVLTDAGRDEIYGLDVNFP